MDTPWSEQALQEIPLPEYPRPQMVRQDWMNLNGLWDYAITDSSRFPTAFDGQIRVPFSPESPLSGVNRSLKSGEYLVLWCTGGTTASDADPYCTGFALSQEGETLFLIDPGCLEIAELTLPALETDFSYARTATGEYRTTANVTPGAANRFSD